MGENINSAKNGKNSAICFRKTKEKTCSQQPVLLKYKELFSMHVVKQLLKNHYFYEKLLEVLAACA